MRFRDRWVGAQESSGAMRCVAKEEPLRLDRWPHWGWCSRDVLGKVFSPLGPSPSPWLAARGFCTGGLYCRRAASACLGRIFARPDCTDEMGHVCLDWPTGIRKMKMIVRLPSFSALLDISRTVEAQMKGFVTEFVEAEAQRSSGDCHTVQRANSMP